MANAPVALQPIELSKNKPRFPLQIRQIIHDAEFNYARKVLPYRLDETGTKVEDTLVGTVSADSPLGGIGQDVYIRWSTEAEKARWIELHSKEDWFIALPESQQAAPVNILVDGFGRVSALIEEYGDTTEVQCRLLDTYEAVDGIEVSLILNNAHRGSSPLDLADSFTTLKKSKGYSQVQIGRRFGYGKAYVSMLLKVAKLKPEDRARAIKQGWPVKKMIQVVDSYSEPDGANSPEAGDTFKRKSKLAIDSLIDYGLAEALDVVKDGSPDHKTLWAMQFAAEWSMGRYGDISFVEAMKDQEILPKFSFDIDKAAKLAGEPEPESTPPPPAAAKPKTVAKSKAAAKSKTVAKPKATAKSKTVAKTVAKPKATTKSKPKVTPVPAVKAAPIVVPPPPEPPTS